MRIFISGPMSGIKDFNKAAFMEAEKQVLTSGNIPLNPWRQDLLHHDWPHCMIEALKLLSTADAIYFLQEAENSPGSNIERMFAERAGVKTIDDLCL